VQTQMYYLLLALYSQSASFRVPEEHTFQSSLPLPSVTAITGLLGAALGHDFETAMHFRQKNNLNFGICGTSGSSAYDLWKHRKIKSKETISSVLKREILFDVSIELVIAGENLNILEDIYKAFIDPYFSLCLGTSDDIAKLTHITKPAAIKTTLISTVENTYLKGDLSGKYTSSLEIKDIPLDKTIHPPRVYLLPTEYSFKNGARKLTKKEAFTFVSHPVTLEHPVEGIECSKRRFPLI
jgi:CRISPR-associated protein Cas5t